MHVGSCSARQLLMTQLDVAQVAFVASSSLPQTRLSDWEQTTRGETRAENLPPEGPGNPIFFSQLLFEGSHLFLNSGFDFTINDLLNDISEIEWNLIQIFQFIWKVHIFLWMVISCSLVMLVNNMWIVVH